MEHFKLGLFWVLAKELNLSYHSKEAIIFFTIDPDYGYFNKFLKKAPVMVRRFVSNPASPCNPNPKTRSPNPTTLGFTPFLLKPTIWLMDKILHYPL